jgi:hypothetical protein
MLLSLYIDTTSENLKKSAHLTLSGIQKQDKKIYIFFFFVKAGTKP